MIAPDLLERIHRRTAGNPLIEQGRAMEVLGLLQPIIARFDEDSDNSDLNQARKLVAGACYRL